MSDTRSKPLRLSELTTALDQFFKKRFSNRPFWVIAEVSNHQFYSKSNRHYLKLIEKFEGRDQIAAEMGAVIWGNVHARVEHFEQQTGQKFRNGLEVLTQCEVTFHPVYGMKLTVLDIDPSFTMGRLEKMRQETLRKLCEEHPEVVRKVGQEHRTFNQDRPVPRVIRKIALVTSSKAAGFDDFLHTLKQNEFGYTFEIDMYFAPVQGMESWPLITSRLAEINQKFEEYDCAVIVRGGGSQTDLMLFDQYALSLEIARCAVPVFTGIGHHRDQSIADLFCHTRLKTPTKVAEHIIVRNRDFETEMLGGLDKVFDHTRAQLKEHRRNLNQASVAISSELPDRIREQQQILQEHRGTVIKASMEVVQNQKGRLRRLEQQLVSSSRKQIQWERKELAQILLEMNKDAKNLLAKKRDQINFIQRLVKLSDPEQVLKKGYAMIYKGDKILTKSTDAKSGEEVRIRFRDGDRSAEIKD